MRSTLKYTLRLHDHIGSITRTYFEFRAPFFDQHQIDSDVRAHQAYVQDVLTDRAHYSDLTPDQKYLHDLGGLVSPVLSTYRLRLRLPRLKPRTGDIRASSRLEECCQQLAILAYNFRERIKAFAESTVDIVHETEERRETRTQVSNIIKEYDRKNQRILRFRNFVVHGPKGRVDEFADLRTWELAGLFMHNDLWFDYNNAFEETRSEWIIVCRNLIASMETTVAKVQLLNETLISKRLLNFLRTDDGPKAA